MKYRKILLVTLALLAILTIGTASAAQDLAVNETQDLIESSVEEADIIGDDVGNETVIDERVDPEMTVEIDDEYAQYEENVYLNVELPEDATGEITLYANDKEYGMLDIEYDWRSFDYPLYDFGTYDFRIEYSGDEVYAPAIWNGTFVLENTKYTIKMDDVDYGSQYAYLYTPWTFSGDITVTIKGKKYDVTHYYNEEDDYDSFYFDASLLDYGYNNITITTKGDSKFGAYQDEKIIEVRSRVDYPDFIDYGSDEVISLTLPDDATGTFTLYYENYNGETGEYDYDEIIREEVENGYASIPMNIFDVGYKNILAKYEGNYMGIENYISFDVRPIFALPKVLVIGEKAYVTIEGSENLEGTLTVEVLSDEDYYEDDAEPILTFDTLVANGEGRVEITDLDEGRYYLHAIFENEDSNYDDGEILNVVESTDFEIEVECNFDEILINSDENYIIITLPEYATGMVGFYIDDKLTDTWTVDDNYYSWEIPTQGLDYGTHKLTVRYTSDEYNNSTWETEFEVTSAIIYIPETFDYNKEHEWYSGMDISVSVNEDATGTITVLFDDEEYETVELNGEGNYYPITIKNLPTGTYNVTVTYSGDGKYQALRESQSMVIDYTIAIYDIEFRYGDEYSIFIHPPKDIDLSKLSASVDGQEYEIEENEGHYKITASDLTYGTHELNVKYSGDEKYSSKEFIENITVESWIHIPYTWNEDADVNLILPQDAKGSLSIEIYSFEDDEIGELIEQTEIPLTDGEAHYSLDDFEMGSYYIKGHYTGSDYDIPDEENEFRMRANIYWDDDFNYEIPIGETTTVYIDTPSWPGDFIVEIKKFIATEYSEYEGDYINVYETIATETIELVDGKASFTLPELMLGDYRVTAKYVKEEESIYKIDENIEVVPLEFNVPYEVNINDPETIFVELPEDTIGEINVEIQIYDEKYDKWKDYTTKSAEIENGIAEIELNDLEVGEYRFAVTITTEQYGNYSREFSYINVYEGESGGEGEGDEIDAIFTDANIRYNDAVITIPKKEFPAEIADEFEVRLEDSAISLKLSELASDDENYYIKVNDLGFEGDEDIEGVNLFTVVQFFNSDKEPIYFAEDEILIYNSPFFHNGAHLLGDEFAISLQSITEDYGDEFSVTVSQEDAQDITSTFKFSELENLYYEEGTFYEIHLSDIGITKTGTYTLTVSLTRNGERLSYSRTIAVNLVDIRHYEADEEHPGPITSMDERIFNIRVTENVTGYVKLYVNDEKVGADIPLSDLQFGTVPPDNGRQIILNDFKLKESGEYNVKLEFMSDNGDLLGESETNFTFEASENSVEIRSAYYTAGIEDVIQFTIGTTLNDDEYFSIYFNGEKAGTYTLANGFEIDEKFTDAMWETEFLKVGHYNVDIKFFDGKNETDFASGEINIDTLNLTSDKDVYQLGEDMFISFKSEYSPEDYFGKFRAYRILGWGPWGSEDEMIFNTLSGDEILEIWKDGEFNFNAKGIEYQYTAGDNYVLVKYDVYSDSDSYENDDEPIASCRGLIKLEIVEPVDPNMEIGVDDINVGQTATITISMNETINDTVLVSAGDSNYTVTITNGKGTLTIDDLTAGTYDVKATFKGNDYFTPANQTATFTVSKLQAAIQINAAEEITEQSNLDVEVTVEGATGTVTINDRTVTLLDGKAQTTIENVQAGDLTIEVAYSGDDKYLPANANKTVKVNKKGTPNLTVNVDNINVGETATVTISMSEEITEKVLLSVGLNNYTVEVTDGKGTQAIAGLIAGTYTATVRFAGNEYFEATEANKTFTVSKLPAPEIAITTGEAIEGENLDVNVEIAGATGTVTVNGEELTLADGKASTTLKDLVAGSMTIKVDYSGDGKFMNATRSIEVEVARKELKDPELKASADDVESGKDVVISIEINKDATGKVTVDGNEIQIAEGKGTFTISNLEVGSYSKLVLFEGDSIFKPSNMTVEFNVKKVAPPEDVDPFDGDNETAPTKTPTYSIHYPSDATGTLTVTINGKTYAAELVNGSASITIPDLPAGEYEVTVSYSGDAKYAPVTRTSKTVVKVDPKIVAGNAAVQYYAGKYYSATVYGDDGKVAPGVSVVFTLNGKKIATAKTNSKGIAKFKVTQTPVTKGKLVIKALGVSATKTLTIKRVLVLKSVAVKKSAKKLVLTATLKKVNGKYLKGKKITFKFNGKKYTAKTNKKGIAKVTVKKAVLNKLKVGKKIAYTATYVKDTVKKTAKVKK